MRGEDLFSFSPPARYAVAVGNEGRGLSDAVRARAAYTVGIPMRKEAESLNAAVSAAIMMYELSNRR